MKKVSALLSSISNIFAEFERAFKKFTSPWDLINEHAASIALRRMKRNGVDISQVRISHCDEGIAIYLAPKEFPKDYVTICTYTRPDNVFVKTWYRIKCVDQGNFRHEGRSSSTTDMAEMVEFFSNVLIEERTRRRSYPSHGITV